MADVEYEKCETCGAEWVKGKDHPPGIRGMTRPCHRAENTRPRTPAELKIEEYRFFNYQIRTWIESIQRSQ